MKIKSENFEENSSIFMKLKWEYLEENICSASLPVAILRKKELNSSRVITVLTVYEGKGVYNAVCEPIFSFIIPINVSYGAVAQFLALESRYDKQKFSELSDHEYLLRKLKTGCKLIEKEFINQCIKIQRLIS